MKNIILLGAVAVIMLNSGGAYACPLSSNPSECYAVDCSKKNHWWEVAMCKVGVLASTHKSDPQ